ncbi:hypothetical protein [Streptomyces zaomyceticus]|uniref:hypothetical protein n=1 Tax=Streptomyces zaomyceticus TaxID=68286 RepID=UPI00368FBD33
MTLIQSHPAVPAEPFADAGGFSAYYGVRLAPLGEDGDSLLLLGHQDDNTVLAVLTVYFRRVCGERILPDSRVDDLRRDGIRRTWARRLPGDGHFDWRFEQTAPHTEGAQKVTILPSLWLSTEEVAAQEHCPQDDCGRASRSHRAYGFINDQGPLPVRTCWYCGNRWASASGGPAWPRG